MAWPRDRPRRIMIGPNMSRRAYLFDIKLLEASIERPVEARHRVFHTQSQGAVELPLTQSLI